MSNPTVKYCDHMRCYVGGHFCKICTKMGSAKLKGCDSPITLEVLSVRKEARPDRLRKRSAAIRVLEHDLKATYLYTTPWATLHSPGNRGKGLPQRNRGKVLNGETENKSIGITTLNPDIEERRNKLNESLLDSVKLNESLIQSI